MTILANLTDALQTLFTTDADELASQTGFCARKRRWTGPAFLQALVFGWLARPHASLERLAEHGATSKQALAQRFTPAAVAFLGATLAHALKITLNGGRTAEIPLLTRFNGVFVEDCTTASLHPRCAADFPGCGGSTAAAGLAAVKVFARYELTTGVITCIQCGPGRTSDVVAGRAQVDLPPGSLRLADLGFLDTALLASYRERGVSWISRLGAGMKVAPAEGGRAVWAYEFLAGVAGDTVDTMVVAGGLACRLLAWRCPAEVVEIRLKRLQKGAAKKGRAVGARQREMANWTVLITDLGPERLSGAEAYQLYRARWQVELLFKRWKSLGGWGESAGRTRERVLCECLAKLLGQVVANWGVMVSGGPLGGLSAEKVVGLVRELAGDLGDAFRRGVVAVAEVVGELLEELGRFRGSKRGRATTRECLLNPTPPGLS